MTTPPGAVPSEGAAAAAGPVVAQPFETQFLRNLIREELEEVRDQMREDILNLHMEMLKQFHIHKVGVSWCATHREPVACQVKQCQLAISLRGPSQRHGQC